MWQCGRGVCVDVEGKGVGGDGSNQYIEQSGNSYPIARTSETIAAEQGINQDRLL